MRFHLKTFLIATLIVPLVGACVYLNLFPPPVDVIVALENIDQHRKLDENNTIIEKWPNDVAPVDRVTHSEIGNRLYSTRSVRQGFPLTSENSSQLADLLFRLKSPPSNGKHVVTINVPLPKTDFIGGHQFLPGDCVEVLQRLNQSDTTLVPRAIVRRVYEFDPIKFPSTWFLLGVEMTDSESIRYLNEKSNGEILVCLRGLTD
jgi:hypothetical protein